MNANALTASCSVGFPFPQQGHGPLRDQALDQLEPGNVAAEGESYLLSERRRLRAIPLKLLRLEDLRLLIGQAVGLTYLVPLALEHLIQHPLASGDFYPGDL